MTSATATITTTQPEEYDRRKELQEFEDTKLGVKGLVDSGITQIPRIFHHPPEPDSLPLPESHPNDDPIPMIDLSDSESDLAGRVRDAAAKFGFFQVVNHGIPVSLLDQFIAGVKAFHELPAPDKKGYYRRAPGVSFFSNVDLFLSKAATWRDTLQIRLSPNPVDAATIPDSCRDEVIEWDREVRQLGERLLALLCQGLGVDANKLKNISCSEGRLMVAQYYPYCPEPDKTLGIGCHSDPGLLTVLLQDQAGGLQVKHDHKWVNVKPVHGALVINIGDLLQMISNDQYTSAEHRVLANSHQEPRVSIAVFFNPSIRENLYGPLPELVSTEKPVIVAMKGHPGTGKSTIAEAIATSLRCPLLDKDDIRDAALSLSSAASAALNDLSYDVLWRIAATQIRLGLSVVLDSPLSRRRHLDRILTIAGNHRVLIVECLPSDRAEWRRHLERRAAQQGRGHKPATWEDLERLLEGYDGCTEYDVGEVPRLVVDTTGTGGLHGMLSSVMEFIQLHRGHAHHQQP